MQRKKIAIAVLAIAATVSLGGAPVIGLDLVREEAAAQIASTQKRFVPLSMSEPASLLLLGAGLSTVAFLRRRRAPEAGA